MKFVRESFFKMLLRTICSYIFLLLLIIIISIPLLIIVFLPSNIRLHNPYVYRFLDWCYRMAVRCTLVPVTYYGVEYIPTAPVIIVANHQSILDIPLVGAVCGGYPHRWLASSTLLWYPHLRLLLPRLCEIVDTSSTKKAMRSLLRLVRYGNMSDSHLILFPEGQRYQDGSIHDFFGGFVILACETGRPVVPVRLFNANFVYPYRSFLVHWYPITVVVGKPLYKQEGESNEAFKVRVRDWFVGQMEE